MTKDKTPYPAKDTLSWSAASIDIAELNPARYNPRKFTKQQIADLTSSIEKFNLVDPLIVNADKTLIGGHFRLKILKDRGTTGPVDCRIPSRQLTKKEEKELNLRLNRNLGEWDWDLLGDFDQDVLANAGFNKDEMERIFKIEIEEDDFNAQAEYDKITKPTTHPGDIFQLGRHRLSCGDSTDLIQIQRLMNGQKAALIFTDPPYNVNYDYTVTYAKGRARKDATKFTSVFNDNKKPADFQAFIQKVFSNLFQISEDFAPFYCWHADKNEWLFRNGIEAGGWFISMTLHWMKNNFVFIMGRDYFQITEPCYFGWKKGKRHYVNKQLAPVFNMKNIEILDRINFEELLNVMYEHRDAIKDYIHPTQKPLRLAERAIKRHSQSGTIVVDPFAGSGSTLMAADQMGRTCFTNELDPKFVDVIIKRWEKATGQKAIKVSENKNQQSSLPVAV